MHEPGQKIHIDGVPRFELQSELGRGASGVVFAAWDLKTEQPVALKIMLRPELLVDIRSEFRAVSAISHRNIVDVMELHEVDELSFFTMELVQGVGFLEYVRDALPVDLEHFVKVAAQFAGALEHLHVNGLVHGDIKPSNAIVTPEHRVVLIDFNLSSVARHRTTQAADLVGTKDYMAPELLAGRATSPASDWYAFGKILRQCVQGIQSLAEHPALLSLLEADPKQRGGYAQVLELLGADQPGLNLPFGQLHQTQSTRLAHAWRENIAGGLRIAAVHGPSGYGKSVLVDQFLESIEHTNSSGKPVLILPGRCYIGESTQFQALDDIATVISKSAVLNQYDLGQFYSAALARLFPVLSTGLQIHEQLHTDPEELRRLGASAFRELLHRLSEQFSLVMWLDDIQWINEDTSQLLADLTRPPYSPDMLLICSHRDSEFYDATHGYSRTPYLVTHAEHFYDLGLDRVPYHELERLAQQWLSSASLNTAMTADQIATNADGSPFAMQQIIHSIAESQEEGTLDFKRVWEARFNELTASQQQLFALLSISGKPLSVREVIETGFSSNEGYEDVRRLAKLSWARFVENRNFVDVYHDQLREQYLATLSPTERRALHAQFANMLISMSKSDPHDLHYHFDKAADYESAVKYAPIAAEVSKAGFAFEQAANLYRYSFDHTPGAQNHWQHLAASADCLESLGQCVQAAKVFTEAAEYVDGEEREVLLRRALGLKLHGGKIDIARAELEDALRRENMWISRNPLTLGLRSLLYRFRFRALWPGRRRRLKQRITTAISRQEFASELPKDSVDELATAASMLDHLLFDVVSQQWLHRRLDHSNPRIWIKPLALEAARQSTVGGVKNQENALEILATIEPFADAPMENALIINARGLICFNQGMFVQASAYFKETIELLTSRCIGASQELNIVRIYQLGSWAYEGRIADLRSVVPNLVHKADQQGNYLNQNIYRTSETVLVPLADDRAQHAFKDANSVISRLPRDPYYSSQHYHYVLGCTKILLYQGKADEAWSLINGDWKDLQTTFFLQMGSIGVLLRNMKAMCGVMVAASDPAQSPAMIKQVRKLCAQMLQRKDVRFAVPMERVLQAACAGLQGDSAKQIAYLQNALSEFDELGMQLHKGAVQIRLASLGQGDLNQASELVKSLGVKDPVAMSNAVVPVQVFVAAD